MEMLKLTSDGGTLRDEEEDCLKRKGFSNDIRMGLFFPLSFPMVRLR
jgi:hypothetical protein